MLAVDSVGSQVLWMLSDQQNSVHTVISSAGTKLKTVEYDGFGNVVSDTAPSVAVRFLYTGREWDADTQLQNNRARWFDPATGRWLSNDPMGFAAGDVNLQRYVGNSGTNATDPSGLFLYVPSDEVQFWENLLGSNATFTSASNGYIRIDMKDSGRNTAYHDSIAHALRSVRPAMSEQNIADILSTLYGGDIPAPNEHDRASVSGFFAFAEGKNLFVNMAEYLNAMETVRENGIDWLVGAQLKNGNPLSVVSQFLRWSMGQRERAMKYETIDWSIEANEQLDLPETNLKRLRPEKNPFDVVPGLGKMFPEMGKHPDHPFDFLGQVKQAQQAREEQLRVDRAVLAELDSLVLEKKATKYGNYYYVVDVINGQVIYNIYSTVDGRPKIVDSGVVPNIENIDPNYLTERNRRQNIGVLRIQQYIDNIITANDNSNASDIAIAYSILPFGSAWMSASEGNGLEAALSGSADALLFMTGPFGFVIKASRSAKAVYALSAAVNASLGLYRGVQSYNAFDNGENFRGSLFLGETFLRLLGAAGAARAFRKWSNCFPADTPIATEHGPRPIQDVRLADRVWAFDLVAGEWKLQHVIETYQHEHDGEIVAVTVAGELIESTGHHPWWVVCGEDLGGRPQPEHVPGNPSTYRGEGRWVDAIDLRVADVLLLRSGEKAAITSLVARHAQLSVYNFQVEELHCYAVGHAGVLVHNNSAEIDAKLKATQDLPEWHPDRIAAKRELNEFLAKKFGSIEASVDAISKSNSPVWKSLSPFRGNFKTNGLSGKDRRYYNWDHTHNDIEIYDGAGIHLGSIHAVTGKMIKDAVKGRKYDRK